MRSHVLSAAAVFLLVSFARAGEPARLLEGQAIRQSVGRTVTRALIPSGAHLVAKLANPSMGRAWLEDDVTLHVRGTACGRTRVLLLAGRSERGSLPVLFVPALRLEGPTNGVHGDTITVEAKGGLPPYSLDLSLEDEFSEAIASSRAAGVTPRSSSRWDLHLRRPGRLVVELRDAEAQRTDLTVVVKDRAPGTCPPFRARCSDGQVLPGHRVLVELEGGRPPYRAEERGRWTRVIGTRHRCVMPDGTSERGEIRVLAFLDAEGRRAELRLELLPSGPLRFRFDRAGPLRAQCSMVCEILGGHLPMRLVDHPRDILSVVPVGPRRFAVGCLRPPRNDRPVTFRVRDGRGRRLVVGVPLAR